MTNRPVHAHLQNDPTRTRPFRFRCSVLLFLLAGSFALANPGGGEPGVAARLLALGGEIDLNSDGRVMDVFLLGKRSPTGFDRFTDSRIESIDFSVFTALESMTLFSPLLTDRTLLHISKQTRPLRSICLLEGKFTEAGITQLLEKQTKLYQLMMIDMEVSSRTLREVGKLQSLRMLTLGKLKEADGSVKELIGLQQLRMLSIASADLTDRGLNEISKLSGLLLLSLDDSDITDAGLIQLRNLKNLRSLEIKGAKKITRQGIQALMKELPKLEVVSGNKKVSPQ